MRAQRGRRQDAVYRELLDGKRSNQNANDGSPVMRKEILLPLGVAVPSFALATLSGAVNWMIQFMITGLTYFAAGLVLSRRQESRPRLFRSVALVLCPYILLYGTLSVVARSVQTYPIWVIGILGCFLGALAGARLTHVRHVLIAATLYFMAVVPGGFVFMAHWLSYVFQPTESRVDQPVDYRLSTAAREWVTSEDLRGKVVVLNFWATSCAACIEEFPHFDSFFRKHRGDPKLAIYSVNIPLEGDTLEDIRRLSEGKGYSFPVLFASDDIDSVKAQFGISGVPTVLVLDRASVVRYSGPLIISGHSFVDRIDLHIQQAQKSLRD